MGGVDSHDRSFRLSLTARLKAQGVNDACKKQTYAAELRNLTSLRSKLWNKTRWRGKFQTVLRYVELEEELLKIEKINKLVVREDEEASDGEELKDSDEEDNKKGGFKRCNQTELDKTLKMLNQQDVVCVQLQKRGMTLADADKKIEVARAQLTEAVQGWNCTHMGSEYTKNKVGDLAHGFEVAVKKLQRDEQLDEEDKEHVRMLLYRPGRHSLIFDDLASLVLRSIVRYLRLVFAGTNFETASIPQYGGLYGVHE